MRRLTQLWQQKRLLALYAGTILVAAAFLLLGNRAVSGGLTILKAGNQVLGVPTKVTAVTHIEIQPSAMGLETKMIYFEGTVISGQYKGLLIEGMQVEDPLMQLKLREVTVGDKVLLYEYGRDEDGATIWVLQEYIRSDTILLLALLFVVLLLFFGGKKGLLTVLSLSCTCLAIFTVLIPAVLSGHNIYLAAGIVCAFIILMTLVLVNGFNKKSLSAGIGCVGGLAASAVLLVLSDLSLRLTGYMDEESAYLLYINPENPIDLKAIVFTAIILGALGATMDVAVSIASSLSEIAETSPETMSFPAIVRSGMNIGRDIMGTMANTLVLAYIGSSMTLVLLLIVYSNSLMELFNREVIVVEILQSLVGSIGLLVTIPITSMVWALLTGRRHSSGSAEDANDGDCGSSETNLAGEENIIC